MNNFFRIALVSLLVVSCSNKQDHLFEKLASDKSNITFNNKLVESKHLYYRLPLLLQWWRALGDVNNDGLVDVYFTSNQGKINYTSIKAE
jgi:hypothetical protein